ncbi:hypothetical protein G5B35_24150 [Parapusillimonas sp. SGNA-6]|uniref:hypothetical protein n=1 Tax=Parapedobacter sp. SGR-10 TaxID=2710879 RepID=UPI0013D453FB|nr:hypothetical protein [Parapedobacter sp. SGR-10]NGF57657.1 hypothetical protein [Parapedobacter sp. SGR-10]NGM90395.1 hypothetical protein [Parapusillimonas sp. SGNA-6]
MRRYLIFIGIAVMCLSTAGECRKAMDYKYPLWLTNSSEQEIMIYINNNGTVLDPIYPDTTITKSIKHISKPIPQDFIIRPGEKEIFVESSGPWEEKRRGIDTLSLVIFSVDTLEKYPWEIIREDYMILQRYDLSMSDLRKLDYSIAYPPTEAMRNMKMWPRYGE